MLVFVLIVVIAVLSFYLYAHAWSVREGRKADLVYAAAVRSHSTDETVEVPFGTTAAAERFFVIYGTTEKKYESIMSPVAYAGYVNLAGEETIVVAFRHRSGLTVITHETPYQFGNDFMSLMQKRQYMQDILQAYKNNNKTPGVNTSLLNSNSKSQQVKTLRQWLENEMYWRPGRVISDGELIRTKQLDLKGGIDTHVPIEILLMEELEELSITNAFESLPPIICNISSLKKLNLYLTGLTSLPKTIGNLTGLELLSLGGNSLKALPDEIGDLINLKSLDITHNTYLTSLPNSIVCLNKLEVFDWYGTEEQILTEPQKKWLKNLLANGCQIHLNDNALFEDNDLPF